MPNYLCDYRTLRVSPGCSMAELKSARRRLVKSWHPDRFPASSPEKQTAEEHIKDINIAFDRLVEYHQTFGTLPPAQLDPPLPVTNYKNVVSSDNNVHQQPSSAFYSSATRPWTNRVREHVRGSLRLAAIVTAIVAVSLVLRDLSAPDSPDPHVASTIANPPPQQFRPTSPAEPERYFTVGSSLGEVYAIQGTPSAIANGVWHYGKSSVYFKEGLVTAWNHDPANPLKAALIVPPTKNSSGFFTIGSTKADVRAAQGSPLVESESLWDFGLSKVYFEDGRVVGWDNSPMHPLKARK